MADTPDIRPDETMGTITVGWGPGVTFRDSQRIELVTGEPADIIDEIGTWMSSGRLSPGWYTANAASQTLDGYESRFGLALVAANYQNAATIALLEARSEPVPAELADARREAPSTEPTLSSEVPVVWVPDIDDEPVISESAGALCPAGGRGDEERTDGDREIGFLRSLAHAGIVVFAEDG